MTPGRAHRLHCLDCTDIAFYGMVSHYGDLGRFCSVSKRRRGNSDWHLWFHFTGFFITPPFEDWYLGKQNPTCSPAVSVTETSRRLRKNALGLLDEVLLYEMSTSSLPRRSCYCRNKSVPSSAVGDRAAMPHSLFHPSPSSRLRWVSIVTNDAALG